MQEGGPSQLFVDQLDVYFLRAGLDTANFEPVLTVGGTLNYVLNQSPIVLAGSATVTDMDNANFAGGRLLVQIANGASTANRLQIGSAFTIDANNRVLHGGTIIGRLNSDGGVGTTKMRVNFNAAATKSIVQSLVRSITFKTVGGLTGVREVLFSVTDGEGGISGRQTITVNVS